MQADIFREIIETSRLLELMISDEGLSSTATTVANVCITSLRKGSKILLAGNGGSAASAQHLAAELVGRLLYNRPSIPALALTADTVTLTAISNDYSYDQVFSHQIDSIGYSGDILITLSTSGRSRNLLKALEHARRKGLVTVCFLGSNPGEIGCLCDYCLHIPSGEAQKVQVGHMILGHILCVLIERAMFPIT